MTNAGDSSVDSSRASATASLTRHRVGDLVDVQQLEDPDPQELRSTAGIRSSVQPAAYAAISSSISVAVRDDTLDQRDRVVGSPAASAPPARAAERLAERQAAQLGLEEDVQRPLARLGAGTHGVSP